MSSSEKPSPKPWMLVLDIDRTPFEDGPRSRRLLNLLAGSPQLKVVFASRRTKRSMCECFDDFPTPWRPHALIAAMGTEIIMGDRVLPEWSGRFTNFDRSIVDEIMRRLRVPMQSDEYQTPWKASYRVAPRWISFAKDELSFAGIEHRVITSDQIGFDVIPRSAGIGEASLEVASRLGIDPASRLITAGSPDGMHFIFDIPAKGILVGRAAETSHLQIDPHRCFHAREPVADGLIEGLRHWKAPVAT